jgi:hypothetical protein
MMSLRFLNPGASAAPMSAATVPNRGTEAPAAMSGPVPAALPTRQRGLYLQWLTWSFTLFNSARLFCYLPTIWAIHVSGDSSQHSLWTWGTFLGANITMAAWLYEKDDRRVTRAMLVNVSNAAMCAATVTLILAARV